MTTFLVIIGVFSALFVLVLLLEGGGFNPSDNPNDPRSESEKRY
jgi:hypothetical protein